MASSCAKLIAIIRRYKKALDEGYKLILEVY